jgi:cellulose synthase/poly-beta-1,6-N-acetylglucosamine synthase-like glycosyltransferase
VNPFTLAWSFTVPNQVANPLDIFFTVLTTVYTVLVLALSVYGFYTLWLTVAYWTWRWHRRVPSTPPAPVVWPVVTVQLPIFNEYDMLERLVATVAAFDYPRDRLEVQVLDDSTDETVERAQQLVARYREQGLDIVHAHRTERKGFKAGALADGLAQARGEFVGVFDADFLPPADFLKRMIPWFADSKVACVQARWTHLNADYSPLTQAQALVLDGHFNIEQPTLWRNGMFMMFNGSGGIWRRAAIEAAGGWQDDTITEDMDLSYRAQLLGWEMIFLPDVTVPGELPAQLDAWKRQQFRWAKGNWQTLVKLARQIASSPHPWWIKVGMFVRMAGYGVQPLALALMLLTPIMALAEVRTATFLSIGLVAAVGPQLLFASGQLVQREGRSRRLWALPVLYLVGVGTALNNTLAIVEAIRGVPSVFERTPKFGLRSTRDHWTGSRYALGRSSLVWAELGLALYALVTFVLTLQRGTYAFSPWLLIYVLGFGIVGGMSIWQDLQLRGLGRRSRALEAGAERATEKAIIS